MSAARDLAAGRGAALVGSDGPTSAFRWQGEVPRLTRADLHALSRQGEHPVVLGMHGRRHQDIPADTAAAWEQRGATTLVLALQHSRPEVRDFAALLAEQLFPGVRGLRSYACGFLTQGPGPSGLGAHHDGAAALVMVQLDGQREVQLDPPLVGRADPGPRGDRSVPGFRGDSRWVLSAGDALVVPAWSPHRIVTRTASSAFTIAFPVLDDPPVPN